MKYALPLFAALSLCVLLWASCTPPDSTLNDGKSGYTAPAADGSMSDTSAYDRNNSAQDTINAHAADADHADTATGVH